MGALFDVKLTIFHDLSILYSTWLLQKEVVMIKVRQKMIINTETTPNSYEDMSLFTLLRKSICRHAGLDSFWHLEL